MILDLHSRRVIGWAVAHRAGSPTRIVSFNKTAEHNWGVPWHQDRVITAAEKRAAPGFSNWSMKVMGWRCEPPLSVLGQMLFLRLHLNDDLDGNGVMQIALVSHHHERVAASEASTIAEQYESETCIGARGSIPVLKVLTLRRSPLQTLRKHARSAGAIMQTSICLHR